MATAKSFPTRKMQIGIIIGLSLSTGLASLGTSIANVALPELAKGFSASLPYVQAVVVAYLTTLTISVLVAGRLADRYGLRNMLLSGLALFMISTMLCAMSADLWMLVGARALQGVGAAFSMTLSMALMRQMANKEHVGRAMGLIGTVSALGTALGPSLGGLLIPVAGWRGVFWVQLPLAGLTLVLLMSLLPRDAGTENSKTASLSSTLVPSLVCSLIVNLVIAGIMMTTLVVGPFYLNLGLGLNAAQTGLVMAAGPVMSIFSGVPSGRLVDVWGSRRVLAIGLVLVSVGAFMLAFVPNMIGVEGYILSMIILTPGYQLFQAANNTFALQNVAQERRGTVSGLLGLSRNLGLIAGACLMGRVFDYGVGTDDIALAPPSAIAAGVRLAFGVASIGAVTGLILVLCLSRSLRRGAR